MFSDSDRQLNSEKSIKSVLKRQKRSIQLKSILKIASDFSFFLIDERVESGRDLPTWKNTFEGGRRSEKMKKLKAAHFKNAVKDRER